MQRFSSLILPAIAAVLLTACSASEHYMPPVYSCDCGTLVLDGDSLQVLGAEFVYLQQEDSLFSRRYFVTADAQAEGESEEHGVSLILDVPNVQQGAVFYPAEQYHQGYYFDNTPQGYCQMVIAPKLKKLGLKY